MWTSRAGLRGDVDRVPVSAHRLVALVARQWVRRVQVAMAVQGRRRSHGLRQKLTLDRPRARLAHLEAPVGLWAQELTRRRLLRLERHFVIAVHDSVESGLAGAPQGVDVRRRLRWLLALSLGARLRVWSDLRRQDVDHAVALDVHGFRRVERGESLEVGQRLLRLMVHLVLEIARVRLYQLRPSLPIHSAFDFIVV